MTPPFGRRLCQVSASKPTSGYHLFSLIDEEGPEPQPGQFYMLATEKHWDESGGRPFLPRALSVAETAPAAKGTRLDFLIEGIGPGTDRLAELEPGENVYLNGPLGNSFTPPRELHQIFNPAGGEFDAVRPGGAILVGGGIGIAPLALLRRRFAERNVPDARPARLPGRGPLGRPGRPFLLLRDQTGQRRRPPRVTTATSPTCSRRCSKATTPLRPPSTPAARRRCSMR